MHSRNPPSCIKFYRAPGLPVSAEFEREFWKRLFAATPEILQSEHQADATDAARDDDWCRS